MYLFVLSLISFHIYTSISHYREFILHVFSTPVIPYTCNKYMNEMLLVLIRKL